MAPGLVDTGLFFWADRTPAGQVERTLDDRREGLVDSMPDMFAAPEVWFTYVPFANFLANSPNPLRCIC